MRCLLPLGLVLLLPLSARGAAADKPNTLSPQQIADGWLLLFDGETTFGWKVKGDVAVTAGVLIVGGARKTTVTATTQFGHADLEFEADAAEALDATLLFGEFSDKVFAPMSRREKKRWHGVSAYCRKDGIQVLVHNVRTAGGFEGETPPVNSHATVIGFTVPAGQKLLLRSIKLQPHGLHPIFNSKDLTGWREYPGKKSQFAVTPEGWVHLQNGPGDLQTTGQWADFVLQIDCRSNGPHLNSGVFFRCIPRQYQNGYEAQIRNQFTKEPTQQYTIEEFAPDTHKRIGQKTVKRTAVDYGTGGIYRRFPARREVAKDHEWFTMTVAAAGRHMAVWVNGFQVTDWTDNRPLAENARNGCRLKAGPISLQGHDKTTDLDFRNVRIVELPPAAAGK
jgi:hypothetical protein